jgi:hypothetical protein
MWNSKRPLLKSIKARNRRRRYQQPARKLLGRIPRHHRPQAHYRNISSHPSHKGIYKYFVCELWYKNVSQNQNLWLKIIINQAFHMVWFLCLPGARTSFGRDLGKVVMDDLFAKDVESIGSIRFRTEPDPSGVVLKYLVHASGWRSWLGEMKGV